MFGAENSSHVLPAKGPGASDDPASTAVSREPAQERVRSSSARDELLEDVRRLETEVERYRAHAERTSKLFLAATNYAEWVRERARSDAELVLRKARAKAEKLAATASELERAELELARLRDELARLQVLTDETRARLSTFVTTGLQALNTEVASGDRDGSEPARGDLQDTPHRPLASTFVAVPSRVSDVEKPEGGRFGTATST